MKKTAPILPVCFWQVIGGWKVDRLEDSELLCQVPPLLLEWYDRSARILPWREDPAPYRVWVSEIMLQQTKVEAVKPYYERFLRELPEVRDLAEAPEEQLLKLWEGLGYYNRVRNLQKGAQEVMGRFSGTIPASFEALRSLPGVGDYTAGAIASIAFGIPVPAVDGNVLRVTSRVLNRSENILDPKVKRRTEQEIRAVIPAARAGDFNQSLMELGAMVCVPNGAPKCAECPLSGLCRAHALGIEETLPVKAAKKARRVEERTVFLLTCGGKLALRRRPEKGLLAGLWELPSMPGKLGGEEAAKALEEWGLAVRKTEPLNAAKHLFSHIEWRMEAWAGEAEAEATGFSWVTAEELDREYTLPSAFKAYFREIGKRLGKS